MFPNNNIIKSLYPVLQFSSVAVMSDSLRPCGLQHARLPCDSPTPGAYSNSGTSSQWCHPTISSSVVPFSSLLQSFPASGSFPRSQFFTSGGQSTGVSASAEMDNNFLNKISKIHTKRQKSLIFNFKYYTNITNIHIYVIFKYLCNILLHKIRISIQ